METTVKRLQATAALLQSFFGAGVAGSKGDHHSVREHNLVAETMDGGGGSVLEAWRLREGVLLRCWSSKILFLMKKIRFCLSWKRTYIKKLNHGVLNRDRKPECMFILCYNQLFRFIYRSIIHIYRYYIGIIHQRKGCQMPEVSVRCAHDPKTGVFLEPASLTEAFLWEDPLLFSTCVAQMSELQDWLVIKVKNMCWLYMLGSNFL